MLCQFCGKHEATNKFLINFMGANNEVYICDDCLENFKQYAGMPQGFQMNSPGNFNLSEGMQTWPIGFSNNQGEKRNGSGSFDVDGVAEIRTKRRLNQLHKQLTQAVDAERYEDAAILRDKINDIKKEVFINGK